MSKTKDFIIEQIKERIADFKPSAKEKTVGRVISVGDGIAVVSGLSVVQMSEMLEFKTESGSVLGVALNLGEESVGAVLLGGFTEVREGAEVEATGRILEVPVGPALVGRVVNPLGNPIDGKGSIAAAAQ